MEGKKTPEILSPTFNQIMSMKLYFSDIEFAEKASSEDPETRRKISEDIILGNLQAMIKGEVYQRMANAVRTEIRKPSMAASPYKELFGKALEEIISKKPLGS